MSDQVDPRLTSYLNNQTSSPSFNGDGTVDPQEVLMSRAQKAWDGGRDSSIDDQYWDPSTGNRAYLGFVDPGKDEGKYALHNALNDQYSSASNMYYYGGSRDTAGQQADVYRQLGLLAASRTGPTLDTRAYDALRKNQQSLAGDLQEIASGRILSPAERQFQEANRSNQLGLSAQLASSRGGLTSLAAANSATRLASDAANGAASRDARLLRIQQADAAREQLSGLTNAMRTQDIRRSQDAANIQNLNAIRNQSAQADFETRRMGVLQRGLEGNIARQQARMDTYNTAVGNADRYAKFADSLSEKNTATTLGAVQGGFAAAGQLYSQITNNDEPKKKES